MISNKTADRKAIAAAVFALWVLTGLVISQEALFTPDPADPDAYDLSVWKSVKPGIQSGSDRSMSPIQKAFRQRELSRIR